jgi:hypothetical protein
MIGKKGKVAQSEFKVSIFVRQETLEIDVNEKLHIPYIDLLTPAKVCNMMAENPALHARWNVLSNEAAVDFDRAQIQFDIWVEEQSKHYREELTETVSGKRITDKMVKEAVMTDPEYMRQYNQVLMRKKDAANIKSIAYGFGERGERLVNIISMMKSEKPTTFVRKDKNDDVRAFSSDEDEKEDEDDTK